MRLPISWLREYVDVHEDAHVLADRFASLGFPVEDVVVRPVITGVITGKIVAQEKHPNADRLQVCTIDIGAPDTIVIATAATNTRVGMVVPVATIGAQLPHLTITPRKMRGVESQGMMCSAEELALPAEWFEDGIMELDADTPLGKNVVELFGLQDGVLDVEITSNRVDAYSIIGLARELAASLDRPLRLPDFTNPATQQDPPGEAPRITIETPDCQRFVAQRLTGLRVAPAPAWMRIRLALAGQRPINNLVDISNYVMLETAKPLHFYDADHVAQRHLIVRMAKPGEELTTLDGAHRRLEPSDVVVADGNGILGIGGIMGGFASEVSDATSTLLIESASFTGSRVRRTSTRLALRTEASTRNEKGVPLALAEIGAARAAQFCVQLGATVYTPVIAGEPIPSAQPIELRAADVKRILGLPLDTKRIASHLQRLGCTILSINDDAVRVEAPWWRRDINESIDLVEEVARMEGYDRIEAASPSVPAHTISSAQYTLENQLADTLAALGYNEIMNYALHGERVFERLARGNSRPDVRPVEVRNPLSEDQRFLRTSLLPGFLEYMARVAEPVRIFELGHTFERVDEAQVFESAMLSFGFSAQAAQGPAWSDSHFLALKSDSEALLRRITGRDARASRDTRSMLHPGKTAVMMIDGAEAAVIGRVDPRLERSFDVPFVVYYCSIALDRLPEYRVPTYQPPSKFPTTYRDLALVVDVDVTAETIERIAADAVGDVCRSVAVFDEYRSAQIGEGRKSIAVRITMGRYDTTMTDEEADAAIARALEALSETGASIRS